ncbi:MAG: RrF2 family transcriptional regulator [Bradymonadia bacterium]
MKLSTRCRYATLALFDIAFHAGDAPTQVRQIAERQDIPLRFLEQIFQDLKRANLVEGKRGRKGGYQLSLPPSEISVGDIVRATEGPIEACLGADDTPDGPPVNGRDICALAWMEITEQVAVIFDNLSLAQLVHRAQAAGITRDVAGYMYFI